jgi:hypothetical protein
MRSSWPGWCIHKGPLLPRLDLKVYWLTLVACVRALHVKVTLIMKGLMSKILKWLKETICLYLNLSLNILC